MKFNFGVPSWLIIFLSLCLTFFAYAIFPYVKFHKNKFKYNKKQIKRILIINSVIVSAICQIVSYLIDENYIMNLAPAVFYYGVNYVLWVTLSKKDKEQIDEISKQRKEYNNKKIEPIVTKLNLDIHENEPIIKSTNDKNNLVISNENQKFEAKIVKNKKKKTQKQKIKFYKGLVYIFIPLLVISLIGNVILFVQNDDLKYEISVKERYTNARLDEIKTLKSKLQTAEKYKTKADFLDYNIVLVIDGYGNYYSSYDCAMQRVGNSQYSFWAFNIEAAKSRGYKEYKCN